MLRFNFLPVPVRKPRARTAVRHRGTHGRYVVEATHDEHGQPIQKLCSSCQRPARLPHGTYCRECEQAKQNAWVKNQRATGAYVVKGILRNSRYVDRKKGRANDLDAEFIAELIRDGCSYCGEREEVRMTLDRVDNAQGHLKANVVAACRRCNLTRGTMPHAAWLYLVEGMRRARMAGLFGDWLVS